MKVRLSFDFSVDTNKVVLLALELFEQSDEVFKKVLSSLFCVCCIINFHVFIDLLCILLRI